MLLKYLWKSFFSRVAGLEPTTLLTANSFTFIFQGFCQLFRNKKHLKWMLWECCLFLLSMFCLFASFVSVLWRNKISKLFWTSLKVIFKDLTTKYLSVQSRFNNRKRRFEICSNLTIKTPDQHWWGQSGVFTVNV